MTMKAKVTKVYNFCDEQIKEFMKYNSYDEGEYTADDVYDELGYATGDDLDQFGTSDYYMDTEIDVDEDL
jgi:hypothetical protein